VSRQILLGSILGGGGVRILLKGSKWGRRFDERGKKGNRGIAKGVLWQIKLDEIDERSYYWEVTLAWIKEAESQGWSVHNDSGRVTSFEHLSERKVISATEVNFFGVEIANTEQEDLRAMARGVPTRN